MGGNVSGKKSAAAISLASNALLTSLKFAAGLISGSVSLLSEALHSLGDMLASILALGSIMESSKPADKDHQFGHGKFEDMAGFIEAWLIVFSALFILYMGFEKIITKNINYSFHADLALYVMLFSAIINLFIGRFLIKKGKETDSSALLGDGHHLMADVYSSFAVVLGLLAVKLTGQYIIDPIIAIMVGTMILRTGCGLIKKTSDCLLDSSLPNENLDSIDAILNSYKNEGLLGVKSVRTSKSGCIKNITLVLYLPCEMTLRETHVLCDKIESSLENELKNTNIIIHAEPSCDCADF